MCVCACVCVYVVCVYIYTYVLQPRSVPQPANITSNTALAAGEGESLGVGGAGQGTGGGGVEGDDASIVFVHDLHANSKRMLEQAPSRASASNSGVACECASVRAGASCKHACTHKHTRTCPCGRIHHHTRTPIQTNTHTQAHKYPATIANIHELILTCFRSIRH